MVAVKCISVEKVAHEIHLIKQEMDSLRSVDHPNIVKIFETFLDHEFFYIVMEYCNGGELFEHIMDKGKFSEGEASRLVRKILGALKHMHEKNICHRDLKPENIIFEKNTNDLRLIDFGLSKAVEAETILKTKVGTPYYVAPEVLRGKYSLKCDLWRVGVITYILLCGYPPFYGDSNKEIFKRILSCDYRFYDDEWQDVSLEAVDFIKKLLVIDVEDRLSSTEAIMHPWIQGSDVEPRYLCPSVLKRMRLFKKP